MSANDHERSGGRAVGCGPVAIVVGAVIFYFGSVGPFAGLWINGKIPDNVGEGTWRTVYAPIAWVDDETDFFRENPIGRGYAAYAEWWMDAMK